MHRFRKITAEGEQQQESPIMRLLRGPGPAPIRRTEASLPVGRMRALCLAGMAERGEELEEPVQPTGARPAAPSPAVLPSVAASSTTAAPPTPVAPSTSSAAVDEEGAPEDEMALVLRTTAEEDWPAIKEALLDVNRRRRQLQRDEEDVYQALDAFVLKHGREGAAVAGRFPRLVAEQREAAKLRADALAQMREVREAQERKEAAEREIEEFRRRAAYEAATLQARKIEANKALGELGAIPQRKPRYCCICGMPGVDRGRDCPNRVNHPGLFDRRG